MKKTISIFVIFNLIISIILVGTFTISASKIELKVNDDEPEPAPIFSNKSIIYGKVYELTLGEGPQPSEGATVRCIGIGFNNKKHPFDETNITDENGNYTFGTTENLIVPVPGTYLLYVTKDGYFPSPVYPLVGFAIVHKYITDGFFFNATDVLSVWPPLLLIPNPLGQYKLLNR